MINATSYDLVPLKHCEAKIEIFIAFCHAVYDHCAPVTTLGAWARASKALHGTLRGMAQCPGFAVGGYHHTWIERAVRLYRSAGDLQVGHMSLRILLEYQ